MTDKNSKPLRVLFLVGTLGAGGLERFVSLVTLEAKRSKQFEPAVLCTNKKTGLFLERIESAGIDIYQAPKGWNRKPLQLLAFARQLKQIKPDVIHSQVNFCLLQQALAVGIAGGIKLFITERNCYKLHGFARWRRFIQFHALRVLGVRYSANGQMVAKHLAGQVCVDEKTIPVIRNCVTIIEPDSKIRNRIRSAHGWSKHEVVIGYIGRIMRVKGHREFLQAILELTRKQIPVKACIVGDGPLRRDIETKSHELRLNGVVTFTGIIPNVEDYMQAFDMAALFSTREGMPNVVLESMAAGLPVAATGVGAIPELLDQGRIGIIVRERTTQDLEQALFTLVSDPQKRELLGKMSRERAQKYFSIGTTVHRLHDYYSTGNINEPEDTR